MAERTVEESLWEAITEILVALEKISGVPAKDLLAAFVEAANG